MAFVVGQIAAYAAAGALYVFFLRLSSKWFFGLKVSYKIAWIWYGVALVLAIINISLTPLISRSPGVGTAVLGVLLHIALGGAFFGRFAFNIQKANPGLIKGVAMVGVSVAMMVAISAALFFGSTYLLASMGGQ